MEDIQFNPHVAQIFKDVTQNMLNSFHGWEKDLPHQGEKGGIRERRVIDFLLNYLPKKYSVGTGHIIDRHGKISNQTDIVIYDAYNGISLPIDNYYSLFPVECVYAAIEVKSNLTDEEIKKCIENTTKLKSLNNQSNLPSPLSFIFAYKTSWKQDSALKVAKKFYEFSKLQDGKLPDVVLGLDDPCFLLSASSLDPHANPPKFSHLYQKNPLIRFLSELVTRLAKKTVITPDLWETYGDWKPTDIIATILPKSWE